MTSYQATNDKKGLLQPTSSVGRRNIKLFHRLAMNLVPKLMCRLYGWELPIINVVTSNPIT